MGRQPRSGDIPWLSAHSILNRIGGDNLNARPAEAEVKPSLKACEIGVDNYGKTRLKIARSAHSGIDTDPCKVLVLLVLLALIRFGINIKQQ